MKPKCADVKLGAVVSPGERGQEVAGSTHPWAAPLQEGPARGRILTMRCSPSEGSPRTEMLEEERGGKRQSELCEKQSQLGRDVSAARDTVVVSTRRAMGTVARAVSVLSCHR